MLIAIPIAYWLLSKDGNKPEPSDNGNKEKSNLLKMIKKRYPPTGVFGSLTGTWCHCWENKIDEVSEYEVGTMIIEHNKINNEINGVVFRGNSIWEFNGKFNDGKLDCKYVGDAFEGSFVLSFLNWNKLEGYWVGPVNIKGEIDAKNGNGLKTIQGNAYLVRYDSCGQRCFHRTVSEKEKKKKLLPCEVA